MLCVVVCTYWWQILADGVFFILNSSMIDCWSDVCLDDGALSNFDIE